jgi:peptidoglycan/xylan/chitin deacetylase (PgdA/CDA1 family)
MKGVMYHYVNCGEDSPPFGYYHLDRDDFAAQLDHFDKTYNILDRGAFLDTIRGERTAKTEDIVLTFDDGLADHHEHVLPELQSRDMWGVFYVPAGPYLDGEVLDVHRVHALLGACGGETVARALNALLEESMIDEEHVDAFSGVVYDRQDNADPTERVKEVLNYYMNPSTREEVLHDLEDDLMGGQSYHEDVYMTRAQLHELADARMLVGSHTVTHPVMSTLSPSAQRIEIKESFGFLEATLGKLGVRSYCHPYGGTHSYDEATLRLLAETGCEFSFDVDSRDITSEDIEMATQRLPRYDCNEFPHGESTASLG